VSDVQDFHGFPPLFNDGPTNASLLVANSEALKCGCLPPIEHMWFHGLAAKGKSPCYSSGGVSDDCEVASAKFGPWEAAAADAIRYFGLSATGYVQNRDMEGECNGLLTYDGVPKVNATVVAAGNAALLAAHREVWGGA
jgi:hypothetical protein